MALTKVTEKIISDNLSISGIASASNFKTGTTNVHNVGVEAAGINILGADTPIGTGATIFNDGSVRFGHTGNNNTGIVTANKFIGDGSGLTGITQTTINNNAANKVIMGSNTANTLDAVAKSTLFGNLSHGQNFLDDQNLVFGDASDMILIHTSSGAKSRLRNTNDSGSLDIESTLTRFLNKDGSSERLRIGSAGQLGIAGANYGTSGQVLTSGGSGSAISWSTITGTTINNNADNRIITGSGTANTLNGESELTYSTYLNLTRSNGDTNFGDNSAPGGVNGIFVSNSQSTNGVFSAITLSANDTNGTNQSASFIAKSVNGGYTPEVHISSRTNNNTNESNFKITSNREVQLRYQGSNRAETFSSGFKVSGGGELYLDGNAASGHCQLIMTRSDVSYMMANETFLRFYTQSGNQSSPSNLMAEFTNSGHFRPGADNTYDLGDNTRRWRNLYTTDLKLSNEGSQNDVDGTWGNYTIQEGESDLFLINNRNGKKYKFNLTEVS